VDGLSDGLRVDGRTTATPVLTTCCVELRNAFVSGAHVHDKEGHATQHPPYTLSGTTIARIAKTPLGDVDFTKAKSYFNHLLVSPDGTRFEFLHRWGFPKWTGATRMLTAAKDSSEIRIVDPWGRTIPRGHFRVPAEYTGEWRCDTHSRSSPDGKTVAIDAPYKDEGRQLHLIDISGITS
jgi:hypothetical protein